MKTAGDGSTPNTLTVAYSLTMGSSITKNCVISIDLSGDTPILISPFCHNENAMFVTIAEDNGTTGVIYRGKVYTTKAEVPSTELPGTVLEYSIENSHCQFCMI